MMATFEYALSSFITTKKANGQQARYSTSMRERKS